VEDGHVASVTLRPMTQDEYDAWQARSLGEYAAEHVAAGNWTEDVALDRARAETREILPAGLHTDRMLFRSALDEHEEVIGHVWLALDHPRGGPDCAWVYDIEIVAGRRGQGYGRALLAAAEQDVLKEGVSHIMLNVFGTNEIANQMYATSGYATVTRQMRKSLR
jgi:GNAT superfamily N-acetyltransferase